VTPEAAGRLDALRRRFVARCAEDLAALDAASTPEALRPVLHRLAGAAGTFGYPDLSRLAGEAEDATVEGRMPTAAELDAVRAALTRLTASG
jgi:HPt (histidine-containing phosphotransfer) domain-containing protein